MSGITSATSAEISRQSCQGYYCWRQFNIWFWIMQQSRFTFYPLEDNVKIHKKMFSNKENINCSFTAPINVLILKIIKSHKKLTTDDI